MLCLVCADQSQNYCGFDENMVRRLQNKKGWYTFMRLHVSLARQQIEYIRKKGAEKGICFSEMLRWIIYVYEEFIEKHEGKGNDGNRL